MILITDIDDYSPGSIQAVGGAHHVTSEPDPVDEALQRLREAVKEVTGQDPAPPARQRIGFLP